MVIFLHSRKLQIFEAKFGEPRVAKIEGIREMNDGDGKERREKEGTGRIRGGEGRNGPMRKEKNEGK